MPSATSAYAAKASITGKISSSSRWSMTICFSSGINFGTPHDGTVLVTKVKLRYNNAINPFDVDGVLMSAISDTGPLITAFQSNSVDIMIAVVGQIIITPTCRSELVRHGWAEMLAQVGTAISVQTLTQIETMRAEAYTKQIAFHPLSKDPEPINHLGEAEAMVLAQRSEFSHSAFLVDEQAGRRVAFEIGLTVSGFAGILLMAVDRNLLTPEQLRERLGLCKRLGTHYGDKLIEHTHQLAKRMK